MIKQSIFRELRDIPNTDGFKLIGITKDKQFVRVTVTRGDDGCYTLGPGVFSTLANWMTIADFEATVKPIVAAVAKAI